MFNNGVKLILGAAAASAATLACADSRDYTVDGYDNPGQVRQQYDPRYRDERGYGRRSYDGRGSGRYPAYSYAEPQRAGRWEATFELRYQNYQTIDLSRGITLNPSDSWGAGFSIGYNLDQYLNLSFEVYGDQADYRGFVDTPTTYGAVDGSLDNSTGQFNVTLHWFDSAVTPFVSAGLGWTYIDSNIIKNYTGTECWYHPWYGTVCADTYNTYNDTVFSYNAAIGLRWDLSSGFFVRGSAGRQWVYMDASSSHPSIDFGKLELGMMF